MRPIFTIVCPDYEGVVSPERRFCAIESVFRQSFPAWELLLIHDGPRAGSLSSKIPSDKRVRIIETKERVGDWGHSLRRLGIEAAQGKFILHFNADNVLYEHGLAILFAYSLRRPERIVVRRDGADKKSAFFVNPEVLVFGLRMMGKLSIFQQRTAIRMVGEENRHSILLPGCPPVHRSIDCMQMVASKRIYDSIGGWYDTSRESDGIIFERIAREYGYLIVPDVLGEHW